MKTQNEVFHENYKIYMDLFNEAYGNGSIFESFLIICSINEHEINGLIIALCSTNEKLIEFTDNEFSKINTPFISISKRIEILKTLIDKSSIEVIKDKEELINCLNQIKKNNVTRNAIYHDILLANKDREEIEATIDSNLEIKKVFDKYKQRINAYKKKNKLNYEPTNIIERLYRKEK